MNSSSPLFGFGAVIVASALFVWTGHGGLAQETTTAARRWDFNTAREVVSSNNIGAFKIENGMLSGKTGYDPFFTLAVPADGLDARRFTVMRVRMYSSTPADALSVYYKSTGDDWALGAGPAIQEGWHTYEFNLETQVGWKFGDAGRDEARTWGGPEKVVRLLRLDPGNQAGRDLEIDWVELAAAGSTPVANAAPTASTPAPFAAPEIPFQQALPPGAEWRWDKDGELGGWTSNNFHSLEARGGVLRGETKYDSILVPPKPVRFNARDYGVIEYRLKSDIGGGGEIYFVRRGESFSDERVMRTSIVGDGKWHVYRVFMNRNPAWTGVIEGLRFDPLNPESANIEIEYIRLLPPDDGNMIPNGDFERTVPLTPGTPEEWQLKNAGDPTVRFELAPRAAVGRALVLTAVPAGVKNRMAAIALPAFENVRTGRHQISFDYQTSGDARAKLTLNFFSIYGQALPPLTVAIPLRAGAQWQTVQQIVELPERAARMTFQLEVSDFKEVQLDNISLRSLEMQDVRTNATIGGEPMWQATWLAASDAIGKDDAPRHFRKSFTIDDVTAVESARVAVTADNVGRLWVNGRELPAGPFFEDWKDADVYDIKPFLRNGVNVVGVQTWNQGSAEGMLAEIGVRLRDDKYIFLVSDASWKARTGNVPANWAAPEYSGADWATPQLIAKVPGGPWGTLPYIYLGPSLRLTNVDYAFAASGALGEAKQLTASFTPSKVPERPVVLALELARPGERGTNFWTQQLDTSKWRAGVPVKVGPLPVNLPRYAAPGDYQLRLRVPYSELTPAPTFKSALASTPRSTSNAPSDTLAKPFHLEMRGTFKNPAAKIVYLHNGQVPALQINGKTHTVMHLMNMNADPKIVRLTRENGIDLIWINFDRGFGWKKGGPYDFSEIDRICADLLNQYPDAYLVLNVPLDTVYNPGMKDWNTQNPDELVKDYKGSTRIGAYHGAVTEAPSYSSRVWMNDASDALRALVRHVRGSAIGERVIGYVPISGISWEWFYWGAQSREFVDYSRPSQEHFRSWARAKYGDIAGLNAAWKTTHASFDAIQVPSREERLSTDAHTFLDPQKSRSLIDFREFFSDVISGDVLEFCRVIKEESKGESLTGTYYGYNMQVVSSYLAQNTGHMALHKALQSPYIDFFMSPSRYDDRGIGGGSGFMMTVDSIKLHGKYYIDQADIRTTNASGPGGELARLDTIAESAAVLEREFANTVTSGVACQWYDFGLGWTSADARLMDVVGHLQKIEADLQKVPRKTMNPASNIAVIVDEKSTFYTGTQSDIHAAALHNQINQLHRSGVGFDSYVLDDLEKMPEYKCYLFLNTFRITPEQQKFIDQKLKRDGRVLAWVYAPGVINEEKLDFNRASQITGISLGVLDKTAPLRVQVAPGTHPLLRSIKSKIAYGSASSDGPLLYATDGQTLGNIENTEVAGLAVKKFDDWTSVFSAAPTLPATLLRGIAETAGVPVVNSFEGDITYVGDRLFAVHTFGGGERTFSVPNANGVVKELLRGAEFAIQNGKVTATLPEKSTSLFLLPAS